MVYGISKLSIIKMIFVWFLSPKKATYIKNNFNFFSNTLKLVYNKEDF